MHILIITPGFPENENDTDCIPPLQEYLKELTKRFTEIKISVVAIHYPDKKNKYCWERINVYSCGGKRRKQPVRIFYWLRAIYYSLKINKKNQVNLIHSFWLNENAMIGNILSRLLKVKHINTMMGQDAKAGNKYHKIINLKNIFKVALTEFQAGYFRESCNMNPDKIIPWGVKSFPVEINLRPIDILGAGSLIPVKNFQLFIKIVIELKKNFPAIKVAVTGDGVEKSRLKEMIYKNNLVHNLLLKGQLSRESVLSDMTRSKIFLHTANYESFGFVIAEALAAGCYVVTKAVGCAKPADKLFIAQNDEEFKMIISNLLLNGKDFHAANIFPVENTAKAYSELYSELFGSRKNS